MALKAVKKTKPKINPREVLQEKRRYGDRVKKEWKRLPKYGYTYSDTPNMGKAVHCDVK